MGFSYESFFRRFSGSPCDGRIPRAPATECLGLVEIGMQGPSSKGMVQSLGHGYLSTHQEFINYGID